MCDPAVPSHADLGQSFYCGDMAGRTGDVQGASQGTPSDTDK